MMRWMRVLLVALCVAALGGAVAADDVRPDPAVVTIRTDGLSAELQAAHAWSLQRIAVEGVPICTPTGAYGALLCVPAAGGWVGSAHTMGGVERVEEVGLIVDGEVAEMIDGAVYPCRRAILTKRSLLDTVRLDARLVFEAGCIRERHTLTALEDVVVTQTYPFMHCVSAQASEWMAVTRDGEQVDGRFTGEGELAWHDDWEWTAAWDADRRTGLVLRHTVRPDDAALLTGYWDQQRYRKLYVKAQMQGEPWPEGRALEAEVVVTGFTAPPARWREVAREVAVELVSE